MPNTITDWRNLEVGKFYRLECGCEGLITELHKEPSDYDHDTGFYMAYTVQHCRSRRSDETDCRDGYGPYANFFNYDLKEQAMPAVETEEPSWWGPSGAKERLRKRQEEKRAWANRWLQATRADSSNLPIEDL